MNLVGDDLPLAVAGLQQVFDRAVLPPHRLFRPLAAELVVESVHGEGKGRGHFFRQGDFLDLKDIGLGIVNRQRTHTSPWKQMGIEAAERNPRTAAAACQGAVDGSLAKSLKTLTLPSRMHLPTGPQPSGRSSA